MILLITIFGFLTRAYKLDSSPAGLYIDETSIGYNAYSIIKTAHDEHGKFMPLFFEAFGEYKLPVYIYSVALVQLIIGPSDISVRIPALLFGTFSITLLYFFAKELFTDWGLHRIRSTVPVLGSFLLAVSPWHFQFSRPGFEASAGLFFLLLALYLFFVGIRKKSSYIICFSFFCFVANLYSYNSARIVSPFTLFLLLALYHKNFTVKQWLVALVVPLIIALPFLIFSVSPNGLARAHQVSVFFDSNISMNTIISNYLKNTSPFYLFKNGDPTIAHLTPYRMGLLYLVEVPGFFIGFLFLLIKKTRSTLFALALFLIAAVPPSISTLNPHALRGMSALAITPIISATGIIYLLSFLKREYLFSTMLTFFVISVLISCLFFLNTYHNKYAPNAGWDWQVGIKKASKLVLGLDTNKNIYLDVDPRSVSLAWYLKIDPGDYQKSSDKSSFGRFHINQVISSIHGIYVGGNPPASRLLEYIYYPDNSVAYGVWEF